MQKKFHHLSICFIIMLFACDTEDSLEPLFEDFFIKYYGGEGSQIGVDLVTLVDGGFVLLGESTTTGGDSQIMLVRTDALGNELWSKLYGGSQNEFPTDLEIEPDENLLIAANVEEAISGQTDVMFLRVNLEGAVLDSVVFGSPNVTEGVNSITVVSDGDIIGVGTTSDVDTQKPGFNAATDLIDFFSIRMNRSFVQAESFQWKRVVGYPGIDRGQKIIERPDGGFIMFGTSNDPNSNSQQEGFNMIVFPTNELGDIGSSFEVQYYGTLGNESAAQIVETIDGGYSMVGTSVQENSRSMFVARVRSDVGFVNSNTINIEPDIIATSITASSSGGFFQLGTSNASSSGNILLVKTNDAGALEWSQEFGGLDDDVSGKVLQMTDGSLAIVGSIELESQKKMALIKTNRLGEFNAN